MKNKTLIALAASASLVAGAWVSSLQLTDDASDNLSPIRIQGLVLEPARSIGVPALMKDNGSPFVLDDLKNQWSVMFFGYTNCPDVCPTTLSVLAAAKKQDKEFPEVIFVSIDPQRDNVKMLAEYVKYFDPEFVGVTGEDRMIEALTLQTSVVYMKVPSESGNDDDYIMDHSASLLLINPEGKLQAFLKPPHTLQSILSSINTVKASH